MNKHLYLFSILFLVFINTINAQSRQYDIILFGDVIGEIKTQRKNISETEYELSSTSTAEAEVFFTNTKTFVQAKVLYKNGFAKDGYMIRKKNKDIQEVDFKWQNNQYLTTENDKKSTHKEKIYFCTTNLFFTEPVNTHIVYVERLLEYVDIEHLGDHQYLTKVDGGTNLYTYKNGVLQSLKSKKGINIYMNLRE